MRKVTAEHLIDAIGGIDPAYVQEAELWREQAPQRKRAEKGQNAGRGGSGGPCLEKCRARRHVRRR